MSDRNHSPVIVLGAARSGTKFLRDLLGESGDFARVPYDVNYVWRSSQQNLPHDRLDPARLTPKAAERIRSTLDALARRDGTRSLLEKTVSNTLRVPFIDAVYPAARYIHIIRDGRAVAESSFRMWNAPPDGEGLKEKLKGLPPAYWSYVGWFALNYLKGRLSGRGGGRFWGPRYPGIDEDLDALPLMQVVARQWVRCVETATADLAGLPATRVFEVRYEALLKDPERVRALCKFAGVADPTRVMEAFARKVDLSTLEKWRAKLSPDELKLVEDEQAEALRRFGYT